jgi:deoxyinosine 3'endonuclease (endonuclease V)
MELQWQAQQDALRHSVILEDAFGMQPPKYLGGVDISFSEQDVDVACTCLVVLSYPELQVVYSKCQLVLLDLPYIPGFLGFREVPSMISLLEELKSSMPHLYPSVVLVDGNGILHPRQFGSACHLGVLSDTATIGVAKKIFDVDGLSKTRIHQLCDNVLHGAGSAVELRGNSDRVWGFVRF